MKYQHENDAVIEKVETSDTEAAEKVKPSEENDQTVKLDSAILFMNDVMVSLNLTIVLLSDDAIQIKSSASLVLFNDDSFLLESKEIEVGCKGNILYVIHTNYTNRPVQDTISKIRNAGGQGNILALLENQNEDILKHLEISLYFQIFVAVLTSSGSYHVLEKCA